MNRIYLDWAATSPLNPAVRDAMQPWLSEKFGNPSSLSSEGREAKDALDQAREVVSQQLGCLFAEVVFTSSGTEAANLAMVGAALGSDGSRKRILMGAADHHCVLNIEPLLSRLGFEVELVPCDRVGRIDVQNLERSIADDVLLVSVLWANNETGAIADIASVNHLVKAHGALLFVDAVQCFPLLNGIQWNVNEIEADLVSMSAHKFCGPKGTGALFVRAGTPMKPHIYGGGQEREMRGGTEAVANIVGMAKAVTEAVRLGTGTKKLARDTFAQELVGFTHTVTNEPVLDGHVHGRFPGVKADTFLIRADREGISASSGAACSSGSIEPSHVVLAAGWTEDEAHESLRFTFGHSSTIEEARRAAEKVNQIVESIKS